MNYSIFCRDFYKTKFEEAIQALKNKKAKDKENIAQKKAIMDTIQEAMIRFPETEPALLWEAIYSAHVHRKSGLDDSEIIKNVISADQSWKKSSGHAFEEFIKNHATNALKSNGIEIVLQRDLNKMIKNKELSNASKDITWLNSQIKNNIFDLYAIVKKDNEERYCFGCIQSKTSIRDRVTRDREPSINAMKAYFWSTIIVLEGHFLSMPKFKGMVNGQTDEFHENGWHGMYVFSDQYTEDRIYQTDLSFSVFKEHAIQAANYWLTQRQWFNGDWKAE